MRHTGVASPLPSGGFCYGVTVSGWREAKTRLHQGPQPTQSKPRWSGLIFLIQAQDSATAQMQGLFRTLEDYASGVS